MANNPETLPQSYKQLQLQLGHHLQNIYQNTDSVPDIGGLVDSCIEAMGLDTSCTSPVPYTNYWSERDAVLISYGDSIMSDTEPPLQVLHDFLLHTCEKVFNSVHILPFFPYSSDDGFAVIDYDSVDKRLGGWQDIEAISRP